jgi:adenosylmethionine-8-amino-7-oxononanoate aminotransferase
MHWHPLSDMAGVAADGQLVLSSGEGAYVSDQRGRDGGATFFVSLPLSGDRS